MAEHREEVILRLARRFGTDTQLLGLLVEPRSLRCQRDSVAIAVTTKHVD